MVVSFKLNILQSKNGLFFFNINFFYSAWHKSQGTWLLYFTHGSRSHLVFVFSCSEAHSSRLMAHGILFGASSPFCLFSFLAHGSRLMVRLRMVCLHLIIATLLVLFFPLLTKYIPLFGLSSYFSFCFNSRFSTTLPITSNTSISCFSVVPLYTFILFGSIIKVVTSLVLLVFVFF